MVRRTSALFLALTLLLGAGCAKTPPHNREQEAEVPPDAQSGAPTPDASERPDAGAVVPPQSDAGPMGGSCGPITSDGICAGSTLKYCQNNVVVNRDCAQSGTACQCSGSYCDCMGGGSPTPDYCGDIPSGGTCWNGYLEYCDFTGAPVVVDCWSAGGYCDCDFFGGCDCYYDGYYYW